MMLMPLGTFLACCHSSLAVLSSRSGIVSSSGSLGLSLIGIILNSKPVKYQSIQCLLAIIIAVLP